MRRAAVILLVLLLLVPSWPRPATPQLAVVDVAAIGQLVSLLQQMIQMVGLSTKDLLALSHLPVVLSMAEDILVAYEEVSGLIEELDTRAQGWSQLAGAAAGLCDGAAYAAWAGQASVWSSQGVGLIMDTRRIVGRLMNIMGAVQRLAATIGALTGSTSGLMALNAQAAATNTVLTKLFMGMLLGDQVQAGKQLMEDVTTRAMGCMKARRFSRE